MNNKYFIDIHVLATSLFIILMENNSDIREVSFKQLSKFRKIVDEEAKNNNLKLIFVLSRDDTIKFFCNYRDTFYHGENDLIKVREGVTPYHLIWDRAYLPLDALLLLEEKEIVDKTLDMMNLKKTNEPKRDLYYYINDLKTKLDEYALNMEYEKCIELRGKYIELKNMEKYYGTKKGKKKILTNSTDHREQDE